MGDFMAKKILSQRETAALRLLGNPYAFIDYQSETYDLFSNVNAASKDLEVKRDDENGSDSVSAYTKEERAALRRGGNPYAFIRDGSEDTANLTDNFSVPEAPPCAHAIAKSTSLSKLDFERESRRIFGQYMPVMEKGKLRQEHRDFISRNSSRNGQERFALLAGLRKYDLSDLGVRPLFNRERAALTDEKLLEIESSVRFQKTKT